MASRVAALMDDVQVDKRRAPRLPVVISRATVRRKNEQPADAVLHDLSIYGCRVMSPVKLNEGEALTLRFAGTTPVAAKVVWSDGIFTGCRFDAPIANSVFRAFTLSGFERADPVAPIGTAKNIDEPSSD